ncbi:MAG: hypothetical protein HY836_04425 [Aquabacterium sp.]|uniref:glycine zipper 2TM domain-containing protein n=1 Tax=Aquabacterium sp. TaxID=1872578 RepID=UPI0025C1B83A|nr:hypothetical protein [Aquabacterium sp.]MBI5924822.1 hypothetical protein [Aquabacterium sp.]
MLNRSSRSRSAGALTLTGLVLSTAACAGPRVGDVVGAPSTTSMTVQAKVVSATPVIGQVAVPRQVCYDELRQNPPRSSGAGAVMGAIAGGVIGNSVGKGAGKALATGLGIFGGAIAGDHIANDGRQGSTSSVRRCEQQAEYENRVMAYNVVYEFAGQRFSTQMGQEPGATIPVQVTLSPMVAQAPAIAPAVYVPSPEPVYEEPYEPGWRRHRRWD